MNKDVNTRRKITWINKRNKIANIGLTLSFNYWMTHLPLVLVSQKPIFQLDLKKKKNTLKTNPKNHNKHILSHKFKIPKSSQIKNN